MFTCCLPLDNRTCYDSDSPFVVYAVCWLKVGGSVFLVRSQVYVEPVIWFYRRICCFFIYSDLFISFVHYDAFILIVIHFYFMVPFDSGIIALKLRLGVHIRRHRKAILGNAMCVVFSFVLARGFGRPVGQLVTEYLDSQ